MSKDYNERRSSGQESQRILLYIHGGAYFFGAVDEHRYQIQRHARKLKARAFALEYRLAPQYPFPCGLHDAIAAYLHLIADYDPRTILLGGDSAGAGMVLSVLVTLRDQGIPLPAGALLLSPWVDLTHSFPSLAGDDKFDYIPSHGFHQRPSMAWPPPSARELKRVNIHASADTRRNSVVNKQLSVTIDGRKVELDDQIQMYATNQLLSHPLVSPVFQPSLGGLPPLLIQVGGGELLRDEQIYLAHKAAHPSAYPVPKAIAQQYLLDEHAISKYPPTKVQLQVWEDLCHVAHTLSFTRPAKYMYRAVAQFGAWAYTNAQKHQSDMHNVDAFADDTSSIISTDDSDSDAKTITSVTDPVIREKPQVQLVDKAGQAGDPIPAFEKHMIRQGVTRHGDIYPLPPASSYPALQLDTNTIGVIKPDVVRKWLARKQEWDTKYAKEKRAVQAIRADEMAKGYQTYGVDGELDSPPPAAIAGRRRKDAVEPLPRKKRARGWGLALWSGWGSKHDETTVESQAKTDEDVVLDSPSRRDSRSRSGSHKTNDPSQQLYSVEPAMATTTSIEQVSSETSAALPAGPKVVGSENTFLPTSTLRPHNGTVAYPFKIKDDERPGYDRSASVKTLESVPIDTAPSSRGAL